MRCLFCCHTEHIIRSFFAIPVHKTCEDCDKGVQFILKAAPQHQTSNDAYFFNLKASLDSVPNELKNRNLDSELSILKLIKIWGEKDTFMCFGEF